MNFDDCEKLVIFCMCMIFFAFGCTFGISCGVNSDNNNNNNRKTLN